MIRLIFFFVCTWYTLILKYNFIASNLFTIELINVLYGNNMCSWCPESKKGQLWCDVENMVHRDILVFFTTSCYAATFKCIRITLNCTCRFMEPFVASHPHSRLHSFVTRKKNCTSFVSVNCVDGQAEQICVWPWSHKVCSRGLPQCSFRAPTLASQ